MTAALIAGMLGTGSAALPALAQTSTKPVVPRASSILPQPAVPAGPARKFHEQAELLPTGDAPKFMAAPARTAPPQK
jgi:hypothetical protein